MTSLLLILLAAFGWTCPDVEPAVQPFYNDINGGADGFDNLTRVRVGDSWQVISPDDASFQFTWILLGDTVVGYQPSFADFHVNADGDPEWPCEGMFYLELQVEHLPTGTLYSRSMAVWGNWGNQNWEQCDFGLCMLCVDPIWTESPEPYQYATRPEWDVQPDWAANTGDLIVILGMQ